ncbi:response regulator [Marinobacterium mangrovicola]|uniref:Two-component system chemotaxis response regulator CheY n=1 Tax=Marinobacterium mangrovicola TaxID=1476959 RepID=A0A4R1GM48_9GAMM|nr:response regulator [Marinobacterium mangrovicola]TCK08163.1 two-component system chemotaxis response regulator CheY [Marinobacterium mangrovicola]
MSHLQLDDLQILLIEPSAMQRKLITQELAKEQVMEIDAVASMREALELLDRTHPDLIISALYYDDGSADQLLEKIRASETLSDTPFMLISSERRRAQLEIFKQSGVIAILPKPFNHDHLRSALNATLDILDQNEVELAEMDISSVRTLVVDDSRLARRHIMRVLQNLGIRYLTEACDGKEAIGILQRETVDLVVTDYNMPEVNGAELTEFIRQSPLYAHLPVLMVTSEAQDAHLQSISQSGVDAMADKPFEPETVKQLLLRLLNRP